MSVVSFRVLQNGLKIIERESNITIRYRNGEKKYIGVVPRSHDFTGSPVPQSISEIQTFLMRKDVGSPVEKDRIVIDAFKKIYLVRSPTTLKYPTAGETSLFNRPHGGKYIKTFNIINTPITFKAEGRLAYFHIFMEKSSGALPTQFSCLFVRGCQVMQVLKFAECGPGFYMTRIGLCVGDNYEIQQLIDPDNHSDEVCTYSSLRMTMIYALDGTNH